jgi:two-component system sensor histidine kinase RpfC
MDACATKPIDAGELFRVIDSLVADGAGESVAQRVETAAAAEGDTVADISAHPRFKAEARAIDAATIEQLLGLGGDAFVSDLASVFVKEGERIMEELKAGVADGDYEMFRDRLHALRSGAANIGALPLYQLCLSLREMGATVFGEQAEENARQIEAEFARVRRELSETYCDLGNASAGADAGTNGAKSGRRNDSAAIRPLRAAAGQSSADSGLP